MGETFLTFNAVLIQDFVFHETPVLLSIPIKIPVRFVVFLVFVLSLLLTKKSTKKNNDYLSKDFKIPLVSISLAILFICVGQLLSVYKIRYSFPLFQELEILLVFPSVLIYLINVRHDKKISGKTRNIFTAFATFAIFFEGLISTAQHLIKGPLGINIESFFDTKFVVAPEGGGIPKSRNPGSS